MDAFPRLSTNRLLLRQFEERDAADVQRLAGAVEIAEGTLMPHPYEDGLAQAWIRSQCADFAAGKLVNFAISLAGSGELAGSIGLTVSRPHRHAQLGYWVGVPYWRRGYCTEAVREVLVYAFDVLDLHRVWAPCFAENVASRRVLQKAGMKHEGTQRAHYYWRGSYRDVDLFGLLRSEVA